MSLVFDIVQATGSLATAAALFFVWNQSRRTQQQLKYTQQQLNYTQQELDLTLRSWVTIKSIEYVLDKEKPNILRELRFHLIAYGKIPSKVVRVRGGFEYESSLEMTKDKVKSSKVHHKNILVYPDVDVEKYHGIEPERFDKPPEFVGFEIEYEIEYETAQKNVNTVASAKDTSANLIMTRLLKSGLHEIGSHLFSHHCSKDRLGRF